MRRERIDAVIEKLYKNKLDALLITKPENIFYLTSFSADEIALVISPKKCFVVTDFIYAESASESLRGIDIFISKGEETFEKIIARVLEGHRIKNLGIESLSLSLHHFKKIKRALREKRVIAKDYIVESLREIKEKGEILALKKALEITTGTFKSVKRHLRPNITEKAVSGYIKERFIKKGAEGSSFEPIVATQPWASQPHYVPRHKKLGKNRAILIDMGAKLEGYNSDLTRMCPLGKISSKFAKLYAILLEAQKMAIERIRPGVESRDIDNAARQHIAGKGLGKFFGHNTGHGIGLEIHEKPTISGSNKDLLKEGMVFTVEPGIYIPGYGGLRIEDTICVVSGGCEVLTGDIDKSI